MVKDSSEFLKNFANFGEKTPSKTQKNEKNLENDNFGNKSLKNVAENEFYDYEDYFIPPDDLPLPDIDEIHETDRTATPKVIATISPEEMRNPYKIWGLMVIRLREQNLITLHTACGELRRLKLVGDDLFVEVQEEYIYKILTNPDNFAKISLELSKINDKIKLNFVLKLKENKVLDSFNKLKALFGDDLESNFNTFGAN